MSTAKDPATKPSAATCQASGHDVSRSFSEAKDGKAMTDCFCWTCTYNWTERWTLERVEVGK